MWRLNTHYTHKCMQVCTRSCKMEQQLWVAVALMISLELLLLHHTPQAASPPYVPDKSHDLLNRITGGGLQVHYKFTRRPHISSEKMLGVELTFKNTSDSPLSNITIGDTRLQSGMSMRDTSGINQLAPGSSSTLTVGINFNDTLQPAKFDIWWDWVGVYLETSDS